MYRDTLCPQFELPVLTSRRNRFTTEYSSFILINKLHPHEQQKSLKVARLAVALSIQFKVKLIPSVTVRVEEIVQLVTVVVRLFLSSGSGKVKFTMNTNLEWEECEKIGNLVGKVLFIWRVAMFIHHMRIIIPHYL